MRSVAHADTVHVHVFESFTSLHNNTTFLFQPRDGNPIPRHRLAMGSRPPSKTEFFNMYSSYSNIRENSNHQALQKGEHQYDSPAVLQASNRQHTACPRKEEQHDQRVPSNMAVQNRTTEKENLVFPRGTYSANHPLQKERFSDSKRSTSQILALFSSRKNIPQTKMPPERETVQINEVNFVTNEKTLCKWNDAAEETLSKMGEVDIYSRTRSISEFSAVPQPNVVVVDSDSFEQGEETSPDLGDSLNLSPDSFAACSSETKAEAVAVITDVDTQENFDSDFNGGSISCEAGSQESAFDKKPCNIERGNEVWPENDSESISPLMRLLTSGEKDDSDHRTGVGLKEGTIQRFDIPGDRRHLGSGNLQSPESASIQTSCSVLHSSQSPHLYSAYASSFDSQKPADREFSTSHFTEEKSHFLPRICPQTNSLQGNSLSESGLHPSGLDINTFPMITRDLCTMNKKIPTQSKEGLLNSNSFSSHPGSLFAYTALQNHDQDDNVRSSSFSNINGKEFNDLEQWNQVLEQKSISDHEENFLQSLETSPEFYPSEIAKMDQWGIAPVVATKIVPTDNRTVSN